MLSEVCGMRWREIWERFLSNLDILLHSKREGGLKWGLRKIACPALLIGWAVGMVGLLIKLVFGESARWATSITE